MFVQMFNFPEKDVPEDKACDARHLKWRYILIAPYSDYNMAQ
jgi:hypothetical protein